MAHYPAAIDSPGHGVEYGPAGTHGSLLGTGYRRGLLDIRPDGAAVDASTPVFGLHPDTIQRKLHRAARARGCRTGWASLDTREGVVLHLGPADAKVLLAIRPEDAVVEVSTPVFRLHPGTSRRPGLRAFRTGVASAATLLEIIENVLLLGISRHLVLRR